MDRPGGGDSGQPFIQNPIEDANTPTDIKNFYELNRTSLDYPIRGGAISSLVTGTYTTQAGIVDAERIKKFFKSEPRGTAFINKQKALQSTNPLTQVPDSLQFVGFGIGNAFIPVTQVYNPANTLAQVGVQGNGTHFNRHGLNPTIYESLKTTYQYIVGAPDNNREFTNRLSILRLLKLVRDTENVPGVGLDYALIDRLGISPLPNQIFNYRGGPGSDYGIGYTRIFRVTDTGVTDLSVTNPDPLFTANGQMGVPYTNMALTYAQIAQQDTRTNGSPLQATIQDFRRYIPGQPVSAYETQNIITRIGVGSPGSPNARVNYLDLGNEVGVDTLNNQSPFYYQNSWSTPWDVEGTYTNDIIKFAFECIDNNNSAQSAVLVFRAFLEGQISDSNTAEYNSFKYLGRGETFRTYQGFERSIGFSFKMYAQSRQELRPMYQKLNQLISQVYPDYSTTYNLMRGNVVKLTIGDYLYRVPGFIENINVSIDNSNTPWEIALDELPEGEDDVRQLPHMVTVQCSFKPIMSMLPRKQDYSNQFVPLIVNKDHYLDPTATDVALQKEPNRGSAIQNLPVLIASANTSATGTLQGAAAANATISQGTINTVLATAKLSLAPDPATQANKVNKATTAKIKNKKRTN
jgi:hypothetical protein